MGGTSPAAGLVTTAHGRIWFVDAANGLYTVDLTSGETQLVTSFGDSAIRGLAVGQSHVYAVDVAKGRLLKVGLSGGNATAVPVPLRGAASVAVAVDPDGMAWLGSAESSRLLGVPLRGGRTTEVSVPGGITAIAVDGSRTVWFSGGSMLSSYDPGTDRVTSHHWSADPVRLLVATPSGVWAATTTGQILLIRGGTPVVVGTVTGTVTALTQDPNGNMWYVASRGAASEYGPVGGTQPGRTLPARAFGLGLSPSWHAWVPYVGGFFVGSEEPR